MSPMRLRNSPKFNLLSSLIELVVARRALGIASDVIALDQLRAERFLIFGHVGHVEDFLARPDVLFRIAVAVDAPLHRQRRGLIWVRHAVHDAVTRPTSC